MSSPGGDMIDIMLRAASVCIFFLLLHQIRWSEGGSPVHKRTGKIAMLAGIVLVILVAVRGAREEILTPLYTVHLIVGGAFFVALFASGVSGWIAATTGRFAGFHGIVARKTPFLLLMTVAVGILSSMSY